MHPLVAGDKVNIVSRHGDHEKCIVLMCTIMETAQKWKVDVMIESTGEIETVEFTVASTHRDTPKP